MDLLPYISLVLQAIQIAQNQRRDEEQIAIDDATTAALEDLQNELPEAKPNDQLAFVEERLAGRLSADKAKEVVDKLSMMTLIAQPPLVGLWQYWRYLEERVPAFRDFCLQNRLIEIYGERYFTGVGHSFRLPLNRTTSELFQLVDFNAAMREIGFNRSASQHTVYFSEAAGPQRCLPLLWNVRLFNPETSEERMDILAEAGERPTELTLRSSGRRETIGQRNFSRTVRLTPKHLFEIEMAIRSDIAEYTNHVREERSAYEDFLRRISLSS